jgi:hypothetical protein
VDAPSGYDLLLPPGWTRVPLERSGARRLARRLVAERAGDQPRDTVTRARVVLERELLSVVDRAVDAGAADMFMVAQRRSGQPVAATLTVMFVPPAGGSDGRLLDPPELADRLRAPGGETDVTDLPTGPAVRRVRVLAGPATLGMPVADVDAHADVDVAAADAAGDVDLAPADSVDVVVVDYVVPVPDSAGTHLLLTFSSPNLVVRDAMVALFDAVATTLRWTWPA